MIKKNVTIYSGIRLLSKSEILKYVPNDVYDEIKAQDANPMFVMMSIGHEGTSTGQLYAGSLGGEKRLSNWYKQLWPLRAVKELVAKMKSSLTPIYEVHDPDVTVEGRNIVGNIVAATRRTIKGVAHAVGIAYINNYGTRKKLESGEFDACSLEANCLFEIADNLFRYIVKEVKDLVGVALVNTEKDTPGFSDSNILAVVTAMAKKYNDDDDDDDDETGRKRKRKDEPMTLVEIKKWLAENKVEPQLIFSIEELTGVRTVIDAFKNDYEEETKKKDAKIVELEKELAPHLKDAEGDKVIKLIHKSELLKDEYKNVVKYLEKTVKVNLDGVDEAQEKVDEAIKVQLESMNEAEFKTKASEKGSKEIDDDDDDDPAKKEEKEGKKGDKKDYTKSEDNPLIPQETKKKD